MSPSAHNLGREPAGHKPRYPALVAWRAELAAGTRTATIFDSLQRAACAEMNAIEAAAAGLPSVAASCQREAAAIIRAARRAGREVAA